MRIPVLAVLILLIAMHAHAQQETSGTKTRLQHKIKMVEFILTSPGTQQRLQASGDEVARELLARAAQSFAEADEYFLRDKYLEAEAILDYVLRDLSAASRLLSAGNRKQDSYNQSLRQLDAFEFPQWQELSPEQGALLRARMQEIGDLRARAVRAAEDQNYDPALRFIDQAYRMKSALLAELPHRQEIVYGLGFDTPRQEYEYLDQRAEHYFEMVEIALGRAVIDIQTRKLVDDFIYEAVAERDTARDLEQRERLADASASLEKTISQLISVLKVLGINI